MSDEAVEAAREQRPWIVVVTGATGATGRAVCAALTDAGATVVAVGTDATRLESVAASARCVADLENAAATTALAERIHTEVGSVDGLVHLVGGWRGGQTDDDFDWLERRILTTLRNTSRAFRDDLSASDAGRLVVVSSTSVAAPTWSNANYSTIKAAAEAWIGALASGWRKAGTAAATALVVRSIGDDATPVSALAAAIVPLWETPAAELNGARVDLTAL